jgi:hypothetical protein
MFFIQRYFICCPSDSTVSEDSGFDPRTVATLALAVRRSNHSAKSSDLIPNSARSHTPVAEIYTCKKQLSNITVNSWKCLREEYSNWKTTTKAHNSIRSTSLVCVRHYFCLLNFFNPFLFNRGLSCPSSVQTALTQNCLELTISGFPYNCLLASCGDNGLKKTQV